MPDFPERTPQYLLDPSRILHVRFHFDLVAIFSKSGTLECLGMPAHLYIVVRKIEQSRIPWVLVNHEIVQLILFRQTLPWT